METPRPRSPSRDLRLPGPAWLALALVLGFVYLRGLATDPLRWEEPRRALVADEMIRRGDYVVPRLLGEPYLNKPPMHTWLIVALAGGEAGRVGPASVRLPSVLAVAGIAGLLFLLGLSSTSGPHPLPALVFLTFGILPQYGRPGEIDLPFTFWVAGALAAFEAGRRRGSGAVQWVLSQALIAGGVLTKGIAPLFFHPPALATAWRRRWPPRPLALAAGLALMLALVAAWVVPYALSGPVQALGQRLSSEVAQRTTDAGALALVRHLARYPLVLLGAAAPWSLALVFLLTRRGRAAARGLLADPWLALSGVVVAWGALAFAFVPGTLPRYLIPLLPSASVLLAAALARGDRPARTGRPWIALGVAWLLVLPIAAREGLSALEPSSAWGLVSAVTGLGLLAIGAGHVVARVFGVATGLLLALGALYGLAYSGVAEARAAHRHQAYVAAAEALAPLARPQVPIVAAEGTDRRFLWPLVHRLDRLVVERPPEPPYDLVAPVGTPVPRGSRMKGQSGGFAMWRVRAARPEAGPPGDGG